MKGMPWWVWLVVACAIAGAVILAVRHHDAVVPAAAEASVPPGAFRASDAQWASFGFAPVEKKAFHHAVEAEGKIANNDDATTAVFSPYSGRVVKIFVKAGDTVKQGAPLMTVAASEFVQGQNDLIAARQAFDSTQAQLKLATINEQRQHDLYDAKTAAQKDWQQSQADLATAKANFHTAEIALTAARNRLGILGRTDKEIAELETAQKMTKLSAEAVVTAPIGGIVTARQVGVGEYISNAAGGATTPVFSINDLGAVWGLANVRETDAQLMHVGQPVDVHVLAYPERKFRATLTYVAPAVDPALHRLPVRVEIKNHDGALKPEMFANFSILTGNDVSGVSVPEEAVIFEGDTARVWVAGEDKWISLRQIHTGPTHDGVVEVLDGLKPGESVVTSGSLFIDRAARTQEP